MQQRRWGQEEHEEEHEEEEEEEEEEHLRSKWMQSVRWQYGVVRWR